MWKVPQTSIRLARLCRLVSVLSDHHSKRYNCPLVHPSSRPRPWPGLLNAVFKCPLHRSQGCRCSWPGDQETRRGSGWMAQPTNDQPFPSNLLCCSFLPTLGLVIGNESSGRAGSRYYYRQGWLLLLWARVTIIIMGKGDCGGAPSFSPSFRPRACYSHTRQCPPLPIVAFRVPEKSK